MGLKLYRVKLVKIGYVLAESEVDAECLDYLIDQDEEQVVDVCRATTDQARRDKWPDDALVYGDDDQVMGRDITLKEALEIDHKTRQVDEAERSTGAGEAGDKPESPAKGESHSGVAK